MRHDSNHQSGSSKTIGDLAQQIVTSLRPEDGTSDASATRPSASGTTTSAAVLHERIGAQHGGSGSSVATQSTLPNLAAVLKDPIRWLPSSVRGSLAMTYREVIDPIYGYDAEHVGYRLETRSLIDPESRREAHQTLRAALEPGPRLEILRHLRMLRETVVGGSDDPNLQFAVYAKLLESVPAAALELAIEDWVKRSKYWPTLYELHELIEARLRPARQLLEALR